MSAKPKIEVVQTAKDRLREAYAKRDKLQAEYSEIATKIASLGHFETAVEEARSELEKIEQANSDAVRAWVDRGASGAAPAPNNTGREAAARKLAFAEANLKASGAAKDSLSSKFTAAAMAFRDATPEIRAAQISAIGEQIFEAVERMRQASLVLLESEAYYLALFTKARGIRDSDAGGYFGVNGSPPVNIAFSHVLARANELNKLTSMERQEASQTGRQKAHQVVGQLLADEDPKE
jgi:hypothetical protein